jgi:hypothetical protein
MGNRFLVPSPTPAVPGGGMTLISETVANANSSLSFSSIPGTYKQLLLVWNGIYHSTTGSNFCIRFNNSSGVYNQSSLSGRNSTILAIGSSFSAVKLETGGVVIAPFGQAVTNSTTDVYVQAAGHLLVDNYASTSKIKGYYTSYGYYNNSAGEWTSIKMDGSTDVTAAITSIDIVRLAGSATFTNATNTTIRLYGVS